MMETGVVRKIDKDVVTVECSPTPSCEGCTICATGDGVRTLDARNRTGAVLREGDRVEIRVKTSAAVQASFLVLILPLALFVVAYFIVQRVSPASSEGARVVAGIGGLGAGFAANLLFRGKHRELPEVVAVRADP